MTTAIENYYIIGCSISAFIVVLCLIKHFGLTSQVKKIIPKKIIIQYKTNPHLYLVDEEVKDEFEIRRPQIIGEENI